LEAIEEAGTFGIFVHERRTVEAMLHELLPACDRSALIDLLSALPYPVPALSVITGGARGRVFVDDPGKPGVAFIWETTGNLFLAGAPSLNGVERGDFREAVADLIARWIIPDGEASGRAMCYLASCPESWGKHVGSLMPTRPPIKDLRVMYRMDPREKHDLLSDLARGPEGLRLCPVDRGLLNQYSLGNLGSVRSEIAKMWGDVEHFVEEGVGFCLVHDDQVTSWCLTEYPSGNCCGLGVETDEDWQRQGHGTVVSAACLLACAERGLICHWDMWGNNIASGRLATKLGFHVRTEYPVDFFWFNEVDNLLVNGSASLRRQGAFRESGVWYEKAFGLLDAGAGGSLLFKNAGGRWRYYCNAARAWTLAGDCDSALKNLSRAIHEGLPVAEVERLSHDPDLAALRVLDGWRALGL
jgi:GNAT superfamily N-acetyltransferase